MIINDFSSSAKHWSRAVGRSLVQAIMRDSPVDVQQHRNSIVDETMTLLRFSSYLKFTMAERFDEYFTMPI